MSASVIAQRGQNSGRFLEDPQSIFSIYFLPEIFLSFHFFPSCPTSNISILGQSLGPLLYSCLDRSCPGQIGKFPLAHTIPTPTRAQLQENGRQKKTGLWGLRRLWCTRWWGGSFLSPLSGTPPSPDLCPPPHITSALGQEGYKKKMVLVAWGSMGFILFSSKTVMGLLIPTSKFKILG